MFSWFQQDPKKRLERRRQAKLREAYDAMTKLGDRGLHAQLMSQADAIEKQIAELGD